MSDSSFGAPLVVALDIGTSSARAIAFDAQGRKRGDIVQYAYDQTTTPDGGVEVEAKFLLDLVAKCLDDLHASLAGEARCEVVALATSCFWHSLVAVDGQGEAQTGVLSWADNRASAWIGALRQVLDEDACHARLGCVFHTSYWPAKLLWLRDARPDLFAPDAPTRWIGFGEYLSLHWCGESRMSLSMASGTGLFDQNRCEWDDEVLAHLPLQKAQLPPLCDASDALSPLLAEFAARWPRFKNAQWFPALGDGACSNLGSGCADETKIGLNAGTSGALRVVLRDFDGPPPRGLWRYRVDRRRSIVGGALSNVGNLLVWARQTFQIPDDWPQEVGAMAPDSHGLTVLPFLAGERAPLWDSDARFVLAGATLDATPLTILRAVLEASALRFAAVGRLLLELAPDAEIVFSGGVLEKVPVWQAIVCDALGVALTPSREPEASARGAALLALETVGLIEDAAKLPFEHGERVEPNRDHHAVYVRALERQNALYEKIYG